MRFLQNPWERGRPVRGKPRIISIDMEARASRLRSSKTRAESLLPGKAGRFCKNLNSGFWGHRCFPRTGRPRSHVWLAQNIQTTELKNGDSQVKKRGG